MIVQQTGPITNYETELHICWIVWALQFAVCGEFSKQSLIQLKYTDWVAWRTKSKQFNGRKHDKIPEAGSHGETHHRWRLSWGIQVRWRCGGGELHEWESEMQNKRIAVRFKAQGTENRQNDYWIKDDRIEFDSVGKQKWRKEQSSGSNTQGCRQVGCASYSVLMASRGRLLWVQESSCSLDLWLQ